MAQFVTHIQPTLMEASQGHMPHHHGHQVGMQHSSHLPHSGHNMPSPPTGHHHHLHGHGHGHHGAIARSTSREISNGKSSKSHHSSSGGGHHHQQPLSPKPAESSQQHHHHHAGAHELQQQYRQQYSHQLAQYQHQHYQHGHQQHLGSGGSSGTHHGHHHSSSSDGNTSFLRAARAGNLDKVLEHLKNNIDINTSNANGLNALHLASKDGHVTVVSELLARGATVDAATKKGNTALHIASLAGQEEVVKLLIQTNASVNVQSQNGFTPLYMAAQENHDSVVRLLLSNGANQSLATEDGFTPLAVAMQQGHDKVVAVLLESDTRGKVRLPALHIAAKKDDVKAATLLLENEHNPDVTSKSGFTPLHIASHYGNEAMANLLIQKGADVNYAAKHNISPLHVAAKWGKTNMVALLLEKGASIESKTRDGLTPLHCAARSGHEQVVDMLLERGAPISAKTKNGLAPLHMAAQGEHVDAARILLYHRAPVDEVTVDYLTALHVAAHCGHVRVAKLLLDRNADANARALNGFTPLHIACKKNRIKVVELLLKHGASISATTESGLTPLHVASFMGCMNIVIYLLQHDASPDVPTVRGETPLHLAARANQTDIIRILLRNGAQVDARAREQQTPLHIASRLGNVDIVMLLLQHGAQVDAVTKDMYTALHIAAKEGQDEVAGVLLENGAQIDAATKKGFTPLHLTAKYGHIKVADLLLTKNAPVDAQGKNGVTPLHVASHYDHQNVALLLLEKGASPHATAKNGHTPLHIAARKNQMSIATSLLQYGAQANAESKAGFTPLHLSSQEGHHEMSALLLEHKANPDHQARNGLTPMHLCAQEDRVNVAQVLVKHGADTQAPTKAGYTPLHVASHFGQANMIRYLLQEGADVNASTAIGYTPLHQAAQQGHCHIVNILLENNADPNAITNNGQTSLKIAQKLGYISVLDSLKPVTEAVTTPDQPPPSEEKYRVVAPEAMHETFMSDSEEEGGEDTVLSDQPYRYLTVDEMKSLGDDSLPIDVTRDERHDSNKMALSSEFPPTAGLEDSISPQHASMVQSGISVTDFADNINIERQSHVGKLHWKNFLVSFLVDARGGAMRGCRHSGVRIIVPPRSAAQPTRITCRYVKPQRTMHPPPLMEGEALASRVLELGPVGAKFLGPVIMEVPHFASLRGKEREIVILRSDNGETWREHNIDMSEEIVHDVLNDCFEPEDLAQLDELGGGRICRFVTYDFPQYFAVISRIRQEVHAIGPEGGMVSSTVVPQVQAVFPQGALTKKIKVGLQAQPIDPDLTAKLLGRGVAVSPVVTVEPRRRKFHKAITLSMPAPRAHSQGMINQYSGNAPTLRLLCSITGGTTRAQWEDVTGSTPLTFVNDCVSFTTTVSARFWLMDCRNIADATKMATELYKEAIHVPFMAKFVVFAKRTDPLEARLRVFCMTDDREDKTLEHQEHFTEVAKSRDVEVLEDKPQFIELAGNLIPITKSGEQLSLPFKAFRENRLPFSVRVKDQHADIVGRTLFMREPKIAKGEPPQQPICILNIVLPETIIPDQVTTIEDSQEIVVRVGRSRASPRDQNYLGELRVVDISNLLGEDWVKLAPEIGVNETDIDNIIAQNPTSSAQQAQAMLKLFQAKAKNDFNILENGLRTIHRDDIVDRCMRSVETTTSTTTTVTMRNKTAFSISKRSHDVDIIAESDSITKLVQKDDNQYAKEQSDKYSVEEKSVEESDESEEEAIKKTVAERRKQIEKRLSADRSIPASAQKKEIKEEIITIKRTSLIDDTRARHEEEILLQKPIDNSYKSTVIPETVVKLKTTVLKDTVAKDEFEKELQDKFKATLKNVEEFEHKSQVLTAEKVDTSAKIVNEITKEDFKEMLPKDDEKPKQDEKKPESDGDDDDDDNAPQPKERAPIPAKRISISREAAIDEGAVVVSESIRNVQERISSFETKSTESSKRTSTSSSKQWSEELDVLIAQKGQLEQVEEKLMDQQAPKWGEKDETMPQQKEIEAAPKWSEEDEILSQQKELEALDKQIDSEVAAEKWSEEQQILAEQKELEALEKKFEAESAALETAEKWSEEEQIRAQQKELEALEKKFQAESAASEITEKWSEEAQILSEQKELEALDKKFQAESAASEITEKWSEEEQILAQQKELEALEKKFQSETATEKTQLLEKFESNFQDIQSEVVSKVEEKTTSFTSKGESFAESFKSAATKFDGLGDTFRQEVKEFSTQSSETKTFVDQKVDKIVTEIRDSEIVSETKESLQQSKASVDQAAQAHAKETVISSEEPKPQIQEAFTKESFESVREETVSKDLSGTLKESVEKTKTEIETGVRQGEEVIAEKMSEIGEEFRRVEETPTVKPGEKPSIVETISKTVTQEVTSKIPVLSKRASPEEAPVAKEEPVKEPEVKQFVETIVEDAQAAIKQVDSTASKIPRFDSSKTAPAKVEPAAAKSPEPEVTFSKIPVFKDRKVSEQFSSDSCETVIMQKTLREQDSLLKSDSDERPLEATVEEAEISSREVKEVLSFTTIDETVLNELITEDQRAVTPDDFIDEIIEEAHDTVQQLQQQTDGTAYSLELSKDEEDAQEKSPHPIPEYVTERHLQDEADDDDDEQEHEQWQDDKHEEDLHASTSYEETDMQPQSEITIPKPTPRSQSNLAAEVATDASAATASSSVTTTTATSTTTASSSAAAVAPSLTTSDAIATVKTTEEPASGELSELSSSQEPLPVPKPRTSISSRTDTQTRSSIIESFDQPEDSIEQYPEPSSTNQRQESITSEDLSAAGGGPQRSSIDFETSDEEQPATKFYIGERSSDVITRTSLDKRSDFAFDNVGYECSQDSGAEEPSDNFKAFREKVLQEDGFTLKSLQEVESGTALDAEVRAEVIEVIEGVAEKPFEHDFEKPKESARQPVVHSPIEPQQATLVEGAVPAKLDRFESAEEVKEQTTKRTIDELVIEKTLEEIKESLDAVQEELIESVIDGQLIKQSPSEFEFKVLPSSKHAQDPIYEAHQEEVVQQAVTTTTLTETKAPSVEEQKASDTDSKETSYESAKQEEPAASDSSVAKLEISPRPHRASHQPKGSRWSATDIDSSGESHYQSFEHTDSSRPLSTDVDNLMQYGSSEYETAQDHSFIPASTEFHSAVSTLNSYNAESSHDSMKSFDSESSGHLASNESEATETLVPSTMDIDFDSSDAAALIHDDSEDDLREKLLLDDKEELSSVSSAIPVAMKRSQEMIFTADFKEDMLEDTPDVFQLQDEVELVALEQAEKLSSSIGNALDLVEAMKASSLEDVKTECIDDSRLGTSMEDGSILSISLSSASNLETIMENLPDKLDSLPTHVEIGLDAITPVAGSSKDILGDITLTSTVVREGDVNFLNTQATTEITAAVSEIKEVTEESTKKRGHKRSESTAITGKLLEEIAAEARDSLDSQEEFASQEASKPSSLERDEVREESSDSDYDRYESEYSRSFRAPLIQSQKKKKDIKTEGFEIEIEHDRRNSFSPSSSVIETIVEDVHAEIEQGDEAQQIMEIKKEQLQEYQQSSAQSIPDIQVTEDVQQGEVTVVKKEVASSSKTVTVTEQSDPKIQFAKQEEFKISEEQYQEMIEQRYKSKMADITTKYDYEADDKDDSAGSDSFEMLEQPDISDEFVIVEEVAREAHECDTEGKSVSIKPIKKEKKHDEEVEKILVKSAPAHTNAGSMYANMREDMMYQFEESPPTGSEEVDPSGVTMDLLNNGYPLEESKRWVEMQLAETQNFRYPYEDRLEDIKEEDTDFEVGSSRIGSIKDSFSSTPDYDLLAKRLASREHDDISMSSLQEFESLEQVISLENRKMQQGSQDSLSNGSFTKRFLARSHGDDISLSSLKEFEGLETACIEAHLIEIKAKEEAALLLSRSDESNKSDRSNGAKRSPPTNGAVVKATTTTTTITSGPETSTRVETRTVSTEVGKDTSSTTTTATTTVTTISQESQVKHAFDEEDTSHLLTVSTDSLQKLTQDKETLPSAHSSSDSLEINNKNNVDAMTSSIDSIEFSRAGVITTRSSRSDSIEQMALQQPQRSDSTDSIEFQHAVMSRTSETKRDSLDSLPYSSEAKSGFSSPTKPVSGQRVVTESVAVAGTSSSYQYTASMQSGMTKDISVDSLTGQDAFLTSTESLETSSTATNATYQNETDSQMSSSVTSCGSITMVDTLDNIGDLDNFGLQESVTFMSSSSTVASSSQQQQQQQYQQQQQTTQILRSTSSTTSTTSTTASARGEFPISEIELLSRQMYPGDLTHDDTKVSPKEKLQSKTTEKED